MNIESLSGGVGYELVFTVLNLGFSLVYGARLEKSLS